jgi:pimeloyl-ACP methyl ester carboxylesterase
MFTTTVDASDSNYTEPVPLFFVHHGSNRSDAIPLLFLHGFPGSFLEVSRIISSLTNPPKTLSQPSMSLHPPYVALASVLPP